MKIPETKEEYEKMSPKKYQELQNMVFERLKMCKYLKCSETTHKINKVESDPEGYIYITFKKSTILCTLEFRTCTGVKFHPLFLTFFDLDTGEDCMVAF